MDCLPVLDVPSPGAHDVIGDRAYARRPATVAVLGRAAAEGLLAGGVLPVIKHMPGHGRAGADSHLALPVVEAPRRSSWSGTISALPHARRHAARDDRARRLHGDRSRAAGDDLAAS